MKQTSTAAYARAEASGVISHARLVTLHLLCQHGPASATQLECAAVESGIVDERDAYSLHKRLSELERQGVVSGARTGLCPVTGNTVTIWEVTDNPPRRLEPATASNRILTRRVESLERQLAEADDRVGVALGEALVMRRTLEWLRYKCADLDIARYVASNTLDYLGYRAQTDDCELAEIYSEGFGVGGKAK